MLKKSEIIELLDYVLTACKENTLATPEHDMTVVYRNFLKTICESENSEEAYRIIGSRSNVTFDDDTEYIPFKDIYFREDCYEYLLSEGLSHEEAEKLTNIIRTGRYGFEKQQILKDKLSPDFFNWAVNVRFLTSRIIFLKVFYREYENYKFVNKYQMTQKKLTQTQAENVIEDYSTIPEQALYRRHGQRQKRNNRRSRQRVHCDRLSCKKTS